MEGLGSDILSVREGGERERNKEGVFNGVTSGKATHLTILDLVTSKLGI